MTDCLTTISWGLQKAQCSTHKTQWHMFVSAHSQGVCAVRSLCLVSFSSLDTLHLPSTRLAVKFYWRNLGYTVQQTTPSHDNLISGPWVLMYSSTNPIWLKTIQKKLVNSPVHFNQRVNVNVPIYTAHPNTLIALVLCEHKCFLLLLERGFGSAELG